MKRQVIALSEVASADNTRTIILPTDVTGVLGALQVFAENIRK